MDPPAPGAKSNDFAYLHDLVQNEAFSCHAVSLASILTSCAPLVRFSGVPVDLKDLLLLFSPIAAVVGAAWMLQGQLGGIRESLAGISARLTHLEAQQARLDSIEARLREVELKTAR